MSDVNEQTPVVEETPAAPVPGSPEYDQAMADKYVKANAPEADAEAAPAVEAETAEEAPKPETPGLKIEAEEKPEETPEVKDENPAPEVIPAELFEKASGEFAETGELTEDTVAALAAKGIPQEFIDTYVAGARALQAQLVGEAQGLVGGEDNWNAMMTWAKNLPETDIEAFNEAVTNPKTSKLAIQGLYSRYASENGSESPSVAAGAERGATGGDVYQSKAEMTSDMRDPRYAKDSAFRQSVEQKLSRSRKAGTLGPIGTVL